MLEGIVDELLGRSDAGLDDRVRTLELERRRIEAELAMAVGEIGRRKSYLDDGHRTMTAYLRATCNWSHTEAARVDRLRTAIADLPGLAEALHGGSVGIAQASELATAHDNRRVRERLVEFAPLLLDQAERLSFREFRVCLRRFVMMADADGAHRDREASVINRNARVTNLDGTLHLSGAGGDPLVNAELEAIFRHFCDQEFAADVAVRQAEFGDRAEEHPLPRTAAQRGYDAFVAILRGALANDEAGRPQKEVGLCVNVLVDHRSWAQLLASAGLAPDKNLRGEPVDPFTGVASPSDLLADLLDEPDSMAGRRCETADGQILDPHVVLRAALAGHVRRVVLGADNVPINLGRKARLFVGGAREAALLLAVQCDHPGCGLPAAWCQVDHSHGWADDGRTDQANAGVECAAHNRLKHRKRWRTRRDVHGRIHTIRPDGTIILAVGVRSPDFAERPDLGGPLDEWAEQPDDDLERRCRTLRVAAIRHATGHGDEVDISRLIGSR